MTHMARAPIWLWVAAATLVGLEFIGLLFRPVTAFGMASFAGIVLLAWLLLRGSRVIWVLAVAATAAELVLSLIVEEPLWLGGIAGIRLGCLLAPSSRAFVWAAQSQRRGRPAGDGQAPTEKGPPTVAPVSLAAFFVHLEGLERAGRDLVKRKTYDNKLFGWLAASVVLLMAGIGALYALDEGVGQDSVVVDVLWSVFSAIYKIVLLTFVALVVVRVYRYVTGRHGHRANQN